MKYLISYDVTGDQKYHKILTEKLDTMVARRVLRSQWIVAVNNTDCEKLRDDFVCLTKKQARILVVELIPGMLSGFRLIRRRRKL